MAENKDFGEEIEKDTKIQEISAEVEKSVSEVEIVGDDAKRAKKPSLVQKIKELWIARPRFQDPQQKKSFGNIIKFLAILLVLTLLARGTAGATMPKVVLTSMSSGEITEKITAAGSVVAGGSHTMDAPAGLIVKEIAANSGQKVSKGDKILRFDMDDIKEKYIRENAALKEMNIRLRKLIENNPVDSSIVTDAKDALASAERRYNETKASGETAVATAQEARDAAKLAYDNALAISSSDSGFDLERLRVAYEESEAALSEAIGGAKVSLEQAQQEVDSARKGLASAEKSYADSLKNDKEQKEQNAIDAELLRLDIDKQKEKVAVLKSVQDADGWLTSDIEGVVTEVLALGSITAEGVPVVKIADNSGGFDAEAFVNKADASKIKPGTKADVYVSGSNMYYGSVVSAVVTRVSLPDESGKVKISLKLPKGEWEQGLTVEIQIIESQKMYQSCIPLAALHSSSEGYYILTVREQKSVLGIEYVVSKYIVTVSAQDKYSAAIDIYLDPAERVVLSSTKPLEAGDKVRVAES